jgi:hypothetical protein
MHAKHLNVTELMWELDYQGPRKDGGNQRSKEKQTVGDALLFLSSNKGNQDLKCLSAFTSLYLIYMEASVTVRRVSRL